jgi:hypothetical protein
VKPLLGLLPLAALAGCVPTTRYAYVPVTRENFQAAQDGDAIPLVAQSMAICFADGRTALLRDAEWTETGICGQAHSPVGGDDGMECYGWDSLAAVGVPYESRSASVVPMAAFKLGKCDPEALKP